MCSECLLTSAGRCPPVVSLPVNITTTAHVICSEETGANLNMQNRRRMVFLEVELVLQSELDNFAFGNKLQKASVVPCDRTGPGWAGSCSSLL